MAKKRNLLGVIDSGLHANETIGLRTVRRGKRDRRVRAGKLRRCEFEERRVGMAGLGRQ
jgi:hypothetical protein